MNKISFYKMFLYEEVDIRIHGSRYIHMERESFQDEFNHPFKLPHNEKTYYEGKIEKQRNSEYLWIDVKYGKTEPRDDNLTNVETGKKTENQRKNNEAELVNQVFCLYNFANEDFFIHPNDKGTIIKAILEKTFSGRNFIVRKIYKTIKETMDILDTVNEISFTYVNELFNDKEKQALIDLTGTDAPKAFTIKTKYDEPYIEKIKSYILDKSQRYNDSLIIKGSDERGFPIVFNAEVFQEKIEIHCNKNADGQFNSDTVRDILIGEIRKHLR